MRTHFKSTSYRALVPLLVVAAYSSAQAQETPTLGTVVVVGVGGAADPVGLNKETVTGSRLGLTVRETPASVFLVDREMIESRGLDSTQEALRSVPGVTATSAPGSPGMVAYRGFSSGSVTQLFNGITVQYDAVAARPVDSWIYDRVEAIGGPLTFMYGAGAIGGTINYVTKLVHREGNLTELKAAYGSGDAVEVAAGFNRKLAEDHHVRVDINKEKSHGRIDGVERDATQFAGSWLWDIAPDLSHTLAIEYQKESVDRPYWGTPILKPVVGKVAIDEATRFKNYNSADGLYEQEVKWLRSIFDYRVNDSLSLRNTFYHYDALRDYRNVESYAFNDTNSLVKRSNALLQRHDQKLSGNRLEFKWDGAIGGLPSIWAGGVDYSQNEQTRFPSSVSSIVANAEVDPYRFTTGDFFSESGLANVYKPDRTVKLKTLALYLENRTELSERIALTTGLRRDEIDLEVRNHRTVSTTNPAYFERTYSPITGRAALAYDILPNANVYVQYSTAADPPAGSLTTTSYSQMRDFDLTTGKQWELGSKFSFDQGKGNATVAYFDIERKNITTRDLDNPGATLPIGQQSSRGLELSAAYSLKPNLLLAANYSHVIAEYDEFNETIGGVAYSRSGNTPTNVPKNVGNIWLAYNPTESWELGLDLRYVSSRYADAANTIEDGSYRLLGAHASYQIDRSTRLTLRAKNLTDEIYAEHVSRNLVYLGAPRTVELSIHTVF